MASTRSNRRRGRALCVAALVAGLVTAVMDVAPSAASNGTPSDAPGGTSTGASSPVAGDSIVRAQSAPSEFTAFPATGRFHPITPTRVADTRDGTGGLGGAIGPALSASLQITGTPLGIANDASAVVLNVTATGPTAGGFLTVYPAGESVPNASSVNFEPGMSVPNLVVVKVGAGGRVNIFNSAGTTDVVVDVMGWFDSWFEPTERGGTSLIGVTPHRVLDTRVPNGVPERRALHGGETTHVQIRGRGGVPDDASVTAVVMNVTAVSPTEAGYLTVFPSDASVPTTSNVNFVRHQTVPNLAMVQLGTDGAVSLFNYAGDTDVVFDVVGYATTAQTNGGGQFFPVSPTRIVDTRDGTGSTIGVNPIGPGATMRFTVGGRGGVPISGVSAVVLNVTAVKPTQDGYLTLFPDDVDLTGDASNLNFVADEIVPNLVLTKVGPTGGVNVTNAFGSTDVVVDVVGWVSADTGFDPRAFVAPAMAMASNGSEPAVLSSATPPASSIDTAFTTATLRTATALPERARVGTSSALTAGQELVAPDASGLVQAAAGVIQPDYLTWAAGFPTATQVPAHSATTLGAVGRLYISLDANGGTGTCSATVIDTDLLITAAHCAYEATGVQPDFYRAWGFVPGQYGPVTLDVPTSVNPGFWVTSNAYVLHEYATVVDPWFGTPGLSSVDYAIIKFAPKLINGVITHLADVTGSLPLALNAPLGPRLVLGYPSGFASPQFAAQCADGVHDECYPYFCFAPISSYWLNAPQPELTANSFELGLGCRTPDKLPNGPAPGASGGPWLANIDGQWRVTAVTSNGPVVKDSQGTVLYLRNLWGPYLDDRVNALLTSAKAAG